MLLLLLACDPAVPSETKESPAGTDTADTGVEIDTSDTATDTGDTAPPVEGCRATPAAANRDRAVIVSLPYDNRGRASDAWARLTLTEAGDLVDDGVRFEMGRSFIGEVTFTPDGEIGLAAQDDGTVGMFREDGTVISTGVSGFYAGKVVMDPSGEAAWVVDGNWANNGGGIYRLPINCETGEPGEPERVIEAKLPADILLEDGAAVIAGREVSGYTEGDDVARVSWPDGGFVAGSDAFGDDEAFMTDALRFGDHILIGDNSEFSGVSTRVAVVAADSLAPAGHFDIEDPISLLDAGDFVIVVSGYGDALYGVALDKDGAETDRWTLVSSSLPGGAVMVERGNLAGRVLISEVSGIHMVDLDGERNAVEVSLTSLGSDYEGIVGAIGVAP